VTNDSVLRKAAAGLKRPKVLVVGDLMLDRYSWCEVERVSPEAPIPVLDIRREEAFPGGASNVAVKCRELDCPSAVVGVVGSDPEGETLVSLLSRSGVDTSGILRVSNRPTTTKHRFFARTQQAIRADRELRTPVCSTTRESLSRILEEQIPNAQVVVVSDYGKGLLTNRMLADLFTGAKSRGIPVIVDPKGSDYGRYRGADVITPNTKEAKAAAGLDGPESDELLRECAKRIFAATGAPWLVITRSEKGMTVYSADGREMSFPSRRREVYDVTGAGDAVAATFAAALGSGLNPMEAAPLAIVTAGLTVAQVGVGRVTRDDVMSAVYGGLVSSAEKIMSRDRLYEHVERRRAAGAKIVFTNGCFDLLHVGHIKMLERAREFGDLLVVAINTDASVRRLKGPSRPIINESARASVIASLSQVDFVTLFDEDTPLELIGRIRPDVLVKGGDYTIKTVVGAEDVLGWGGRVEVIQLVEGFSTSDIVERVLDAYRPGGEGI
jgi:D-beta-D-heptose 7-phosphate kinase/D-beta-D-heptose 1-phosphate adenosyltransferase